MSFPVNYEAVMKETANLAMNKQEPGYVRVRALVALVRELSPLNERHLEVKRELNIDEAQTVVVIDRGAEARAYMSGVHAGLAQAANARADGLEAALEAAEADLQAAEEEEANEEDDDPL